ncbi:MAG: type II toxin-antitoxin system VapC family toxin [Sphingobacteriales bacterium]|jgi:tRNA(fMet)-specific endonuclease VapC|nr:type II toxin-antitoxin system VapC family toxin [Sphingobacteriales bacterium]HPH88925.1 type II toxin-antitoxin system VapC family toxin [Chitinophagales bacterium]
MDANHLVIDTSVIIEFLRSKDKKNTTLYLIPNSKIIYITAVSLYELYVGATDKTKWKDVKLLTDDLLQLPFNKNVSIEAAKIYHQLRTDNKMIEFRDIFIAATCKVNKLPLLTLNKKHFNRIKSLEIL